MKSSSTLLAALAASAFAFSPTALHAQDGPPPPPMDQGAPPPPDQQGGPPPDGQGAPPPDAQGAPTDQGGDQGASFDEFYNNLSNDGQWIQTPDYGYAFQPAVQDPNWAPYTDGHWVYTAYGWTWASDEPWGWATYHYGRWVNIDGTGWCWIPGHQWAPAWVSWRYGGGYCGWAPLPPSSFVGVEFGGPGVNLNFGFHFGSDCDTAYGIGPGWYNFIAIGYMGDPGYRGHYYDRNRNFVIINNTRNITNININRGGRGTFGAVNAGGPNFAEVNRQSHTPVQQLRLAQAGQAGRSSISNGTLNVFAPRISANTNRQERPATVARSLSNVQINRGTSISHPMQVNSQFRGTAPSASAITAAREAEAHAPKGVATSTRVAPTVSAASVQQERTQSVQRQATELHNNAGNNNASANVGNTQNHTAGATTQEHQFTGAPNTGNANNGGNAQVEQHQQELREQQAQQQNQQKEREAASQQQQQQHEQALRQQQQSNAQQEQREDALRQQRVQQQQQQAAQQQQQHEQQVTHQQQQQVQQHESSPITQQRSTPQPQEQHQSAPQQQHSSGGGNGGGGGGNNGGGNHSGGGGGGGNSGGNHSGGGGGGGGGGNSGGNHSGGNNNNNNNNNGQGH